MTKILFIQVGSGFKHPNKHIIEELKKQMPDCHIYVYDLLDVLKKDYMFLFLNLLCMIKENLFDQLTGKKNLFKFRLHFLGTTYIFKRFSAMAVKQLEKDRYDFIFQTQSLCDSSNPQGIPVYMYTDHTNLNNLNYPLIKQSQFIRSKKYVELERKAYENASLIFVMSDNIKNSLVNQYHVDENKIKLVYVSINTPINAEVNPEKYRNKNILFVGMDWERKGGPLLVEAFKIVCTKVPDAKLTIIGCKPNINIKNCFVYGELPLEQVAELYNQASVFCMPTLREPFGIVFLEAMFNHLPIITDSVGATPYLVRENFNGYLLEHNATDYANALIELISDPEKCEQFGNNSYSLASKTYTWDNVVRLMRQYIAERQPGIA
jgi:glycosyltransferase involved in cell wall biosynthesis